MRNKIPDNILHIALFSSKKMIEGPNGLRGYLCLTPWHLTAASPSQLAVQVRSWERTKNHDGIEFSFLHLSFF